MIEIRGRGVVPGRLAIVCVDVYQEKLQRRSALCYIVPHKLEGLE